MHLPSLFLWPVRASRRIRQIVYEALAMVYGLLVGSVVAHGSISSPLTSSANWLLISIVVLSAIPLFIVLRKQLPKSVPVTAEVVVCVFVSAIGMSAIGGIVAYALDLPAPFYLGLISGSLYFAVSAVGRFVKGTVVARNSQDTKSCEVPQHEALLGRVPVDAKLGQLGAAYKDRVVLVVCSNGSFRTELCRQLIECNAAKIVLIHQSGTSATIGTLDVAGSGSKLVHYSGSFHDEKTVVSILENEGVDAVFFAPSPSLKPTATENILEHVRTNVLDAALFARAANVVGCKSFVQISSDIQNLNKNTIGVTKCLGEKVPHAFAQTESATYFSTIRLGHMLGPKDGVISLIQSQIDAGGPVRLPPKDMARSFLAEREAAHFVLYAGSVATDGDLFTVDMGAPQRIFDIAVRLAEISGQSLENTKTVAGNIAFQTAQLRPEEGLHEGLLSNKTHMRLVDNSRLYRGNMPLEQGIDFELLLSQFERAYAQADASRVSEIVAGIVAENQLQNAVPALVGSVEFTFGLW